MVQPSGLAGELHPDSPADDKRLTGSFFGGMSMRRDLDLLLRLWRSGRLPIEKLISGTTDLAHINDAVAAQKDGTVVRTVLTMD